MLVEVNLWLGRLAPWVWMAASIFALLVNLKAWRLVQLIEHRGIRNSTTVTVRLTVSLLWWLSVGMTAVGALNLATWFFFPVLRASRYEVPLLLQWSSFITVLTLLSVPVVCAWIGWRNVKFLLLDPVDWNLFPGGARSANEKSS